jgi:hypothetical protein
MRATPLATSLNLSGVIVRLRGDDSLATDALAATVRLIATTAIPKAARTLTCRMTPSLRFLDPQYARIFRCEVAQVNRSSYAASRRDVLRLRVSLAER